jgi:hypothetical protein
VCLALGRPRRGGCPSPPVTACPALPPRGRALALGGLARRLSPPCHCGTALLPPEGPCLCLGRPEAAAALTAITAVYRAAPSRGAVSSLLGAARHGGGSSCLSLPAKARRLYCQDPIGVFSSPPGWLSAPKDNTSDFYPLMPGPGIGKRCSRDRSVTCPDTASSWAESGRRWIWQSTGQPCSEATPLVVEFVELGALAPDC